jgi:ABC-2 type transport system permease protein
MHGLKAVFRREMLGYFQTPVAYVFIAIFLMVSGLFTFYLGNFFERGKADLESFFTWHPWLYLFLIPALTMRLWAEERRSGSIELLMTLPIPTWQLVVGKFLAAWAFTAVALLGTLPMWLTVNYLGSPDQGVILASYLGSLFMAGGYLAIGCCLSALTRNQVIAFVVTLVVCFAFTLTGFPMILNFFTGWLPQAVVETLSAFSFLTNFSEITHGVVELRSLLYFLTLIATWLYINVVVLETRTQ